MGHQAWKLDIQLKSLKIPWPLHTKVVTSTGITSCHVKSCQDKLRHLMLHHVMLRHLSIVSSFCNCLSYKSGTELILFVFSRWFKIIISAFSAIFTHGEPPGVPDWLSLNHESDLLRILNTEESRLLDLLLFVFPSYWDYKMYPLCSYSLLKTLYLLRNFAYWDLFS
jgi:hypothetical protein